VTADQGKDILHGFIGTIAPAVGFVTSFQEQLEWWMRMTSLTIGILVGILSLVKLLRKH
jgi:hypothetical protein